MSGGGRRCALTLANWTSKLAARFESTGGAGPVPASGVSCPAAGEVGVMMTRVSRGSFVAGPVVALVSAGAVRDASWMFAKDAQPPQSDYRHVGSFQPKAGSPAGTAEGCDGDGRSLRGRAGVQTQQFAEWANHVEHPQGRAADHLRDHQSAHAAAGPGREVRHRVSYASVPLAGEGPACVFHVS